jgi:alpha-L-arabinofuranosidase
MPPAKAADNKGLSFPAVDLVATRSESKNLIVIKAVCNSSDQEYELKFDIQNVKKIRAIKVTEIRSDSPFAMNTASSPKTVIPKEGTINAEGTWFRYTIKPHTVVAMEVKVE